MDCLIGGFLYTSVLKCHEELRTLSGLGLLVKAKGLVCQAVSCFGKQVSI